LSTLKQQPALPAVIVFTKYSAQNAEKFVPLSKISVLTEHDNPHLGSSLRCPL